MMLDAILLALRELRRNLLRASLTTLGIIIGVAAVIGVVTLGNGATASVTASIGSLGRNLLIVSPGTRRMQGAFSDASPFTPGDFDAVKRETSGLRAITAVAMRSEIVVVANQNHTTQIVGSDNAYLVTRDWPLTEDAFLLKPRSAAAGRLASSDRPFAQPCSAAKIRLAPTFVCAMCRVKSSGFYLTRVNPPSARTRTT